VVGLSEASSSASTLEPGPTFDRAFNAAFELRLLMGTEIKAVEISNNH
jgi:hypothetical protein